MIQAIIMHEHVYTHKQPRLTVDLHSTNNHELNQRPTTPTPNNCRSKIFSSVIFWMASWSCLAFSTCASFCDIFGKLEFLSWRLIPVLKQKTASKTETQQNHGNRIMALHQKKTSPYQKQPNSIVATLRDSGGSSNGFRKITYQTISNPCFRWG